MHHLITPVVAREHQSDIPRSVRAAQYGSESAWERLVTEFTPTLQRIATGLGLRACDVDDVVQITWLDAYRHVGRLTQPLAFAGWLATTLRHNASRHRRSTARETLIDAPLVDLAHDDGVLERLALKQRAQALGEAVRRLPPRQRDVLEALLAGSGRTYSQASAELGVPIGTIGPTRARSFARLRTDKAFVAAVAA